LTDKFDPFPFIEYTTKNELRAGVSVDTSVVVALATIAFGIALSASDNDTDKGKDNNRHNRYYNEEPRSSGV
jgi:hypothetical protein